ncbi:MAG: S41 family peptidase [Bdellovibrionales bacterium]
MHHKISRFFIVLSITLLASQSLLATTLECKFLEPIMRGMLKHHISYHKVTPEIQSRANDQYVRKLDAAKLYLTKGDVKWVRSKMKKFHRQLRKGDCSVLTDIQNLYKKRVAERAKYAKAWVAKKPKLDKSVELVLDPDEKEYAMDATALNAIQSDYLHFQLANFIVTDMKPKEALGNLERRYLRIQKRINEMTKEDILSNYLDAFAHALDPHSSYFSNDYLEDFRIQMDLSLEGIGATLSSKDGFTVVEQLIPGGAAESSGELKMKDKIIAVGQGRRGDYESVYDLQLRDVVKKIRGKSGTRVRLKMLRKGESGTKKFEVTLVRRKINLEEEAAKITYIDRKKGKKKVTVGLLTLPSFYASSKEGGRSAAKDIQKLLREAKKKKVDAVVFDLSRNGGGSLDDAVKIAGQFFKRGNVVETQKSKLADIDPSVDYNGPVVVLTSRLSASASEIVAGALKDYGRAVVVGGDHTFGKGSVQSVIPLGRGLGAIKVTVGMFYIPSGISTQHRGVNADIVLPEVFANDEVGEKTLDYSLPPKSVSPFLSKSAFVATGPNAWSPVMQSQIEKLRLGSQKRVGKSEDFKKVLKDIEESQNKKKTMKVSEIFQESEKKKEDDKPKSKAEKEKEYLKRADVQEAINIAIDYVKILDQKTNLAGN